MISALELKNKLEKYDKETSLLDYNIHVGFLPTLILFPLFLALNTNYNNSLIIHSPFLFGLGFAGFFIISLASITASLLVTHFTLSRYIVFKDAYGRFNANSILKDESITHGISNKIWEYLKLHRTHDPLYQADLEKLRIEFRKEIDEVKTDYMRELRIKNLVISKEHNLRLQAQRERDQEKQLNQKLTRRIVTLSGIIIKLRIIIKKLKGE